MALEGTKFETEIYSVDGFNGTLHEVACYFNVDPIWLSDQLLAGMSIEDAIMAASPEQSFGPVESKPADLGVCNSPNVISPEIVSSKTTVETHDLSDGFVAIVSTTISIIRKR